MSSCYMAFLTSGCDMNNINDSSPWDMTTSNGTWTKEGSDFNVPAGTGSVMSRCSAVMGTGYYDQIYLGTAEPSTYGF